MTHRLVWALSLLLSIPLGGAFVTALSQRSWGPDFGPRWLKLAQINYLVATYSAAPKYVVVTRFI